MTRVTVQLYITPQRNNTLEDFRNEFLLQMHDILEADKAGKLNIMSSYLNSSSRPMFNHIEDYRLAINDNKRVSLIMNYGRSNIPEVGEDVALHNLITEVLLKMDVAVNAEGQSFDRDTRREYIVMAGRKDKEKAAYIVREGSYSSVG